MNSHGVRPNRLWHWAALAIITATVIHNPGGSAEFAITALDNAGSAVGWALERGGFEGDSDYFTDPTPTTTTEPNEPTQPGELGLEGAADRVVVEIVELHELVEQTLADDPEPIQ